MGNSTHRVEVVKLDHLEPHPNADRLEIARIFDGYTCCIGKGQFLQGDLVAYIPPDSIVPETEDFAFLGEHKRIKVKKLRGVVSMGLLIAAPGGTGEGDDVAELLNITHYEPPSSVTSGGESTKAPSGYHPNYDVDSLRRYASVFVPGESVYITEKIHGANGRFCIDTTLETGTEGLHAGSRTEWKSYNQSILWWKALLDTPDGEAVQLFLARNPSITVYGEVYGQVQDLKYGAKPGEVRIAVFDLLRGSEWVGTREARDLAPDLPWVPTVADGIPFDLETVLALAEGPSLVPRANHVREGIVVKPLVERTSLEVGRVNLKVVGNGYLERP